jgi:cyclase
MLKHRLIPNIILNNGNVVQSVNFKHTNVIGNAITVVDFFNSWAVDEILILDVTRGNKYKNFLKIINGLSKRCFVPLTVGGWIKNLDEINALLKNGADKVSINTEAVRNPKLISESASVFGSQCIVVSIDVKKNQDGNHEVCIDRGTEHTSLDPVKWAQQAESLGAGEILLTSIDMDGSRLGYDLELIKKVATGVTIPVVAFGGVGNWQHFVDGIKIGKADAISAANIFHYTEHSTYKAKEYLNNSGIEVRMPQFYKLPTPRKPKYNEIY